MVCARATADLAMVASLSGVALGLDRAALLAREVPQPPPGRVECLMEGVYWNEHRRSRRTRMHLSGHWRTWKSGHITMQ